MSYTHLTKTELVFIEEYHQFGLSAQKIAEMFIAHEIYKCSPCDYMEWNIISMTKKTWGE